MKYLIDSTWVGVIAFDIQLTSKSNERKHCKNTEFTPSVLSESQNGINVVTIKIKNRLFTQHHQNRCKICA